MLLKVILEYPFDDVVKLMADAGISFYIRVEFLRSVSNTGNVSSIYYSSEYFISFT
jgi:hypothetical protein